MVCPLKIRLCVFEYSIITQKVQIKVVFRRKPGMQESGMQERVVCPLSKYD